MADYQNNQRPPKEKTLLDDPFMRLSAPCPTPAGQGKKSTLRVSLEKNGPQSMQNPHLVVYTNDPTEKDRDTNYGKIIGKFDYLTWATYMETLIDAINWENGRKEFINCREHIFAGGKRSEAPVTTARVTIGKDSEGVINISVTAKGRPHIVFPFLPPEGFHEFQHADGTPLSKAELSARFVRGYHKRMGATVEQLMVKNYTPPPPMDFNKGGNGGGGGGGYNRGGGQGGGGGYGGGGNRGGNSAPKDEWGDSDVAY